MWTAHSTTTLTAHATPTLKTHCAMKYVKRCQHRCCPVQRFSRHAGWRAKRMYRTQGVGCFPRRGWAGLGGREGLPVEHCLQSTQFARHKRIPQKPGNPRSFAAHRTCRRPLPLSPPPPIPPSSLSLHPLEASRPGACHLLTPLATTNYAAIPAPPLPSS